MYSRILAFYFIRWIIFILIRKKQNTDGTYSTIADNPGQVPGSHAVYVKTIGPRGGLKEMYKTTYDNNGNFVHKKYKAGGKE